MIEAIIVIFLTLVILASWFVIYNLLKKVEKYEETQLADSENFDKASVLILFMQTKIQEAYDEMLRIDKRGGFKSDDEVGNVFRKLKNVLDKLNSSLNGSDTTE